MKLSILILVTIIIQVFTISSVSFGSKKASGDDFLQLKLQKPALNEEVENQKKEFIRNLPGGIYHAPHYYSQAQSIISNFRATGKLRSDIIINLYFSSEEPVNASVISGEKLSKPIKEVEIAYITINKGLLDLLTEPERYKEALGVELVSQIKKNSKSILAYVIGHELGHIMNGDIKSKTITKGMYQELGADEFSIRLMAKAGYNLDSITYILNSLNKLYTRKSFREKVLSAIDAHPKPWFRISTFAELIDLLKNTKTAELEMEVETKTKFGKDHSDERLIARGDEKASRSSIDAVNNLVQSDKYINQTNYEKIRILEDFLTKIKSSNANLITSEGVVAIVKQYSVILESLRTVSEIDILIESLNNFESKMGFITQSKGSNLDSNPKSAFKNLKNAIIAKQLEVLNVKKLSRINNSTLNIQELLFEIEKISNTVDKKYIIGLFHQIVKNVKNVAELIEVLDFYKRINFQFKIRYSNKNANQNEKIREMQSEKLIEDILFSKVARQYLGLTKNLEATMNFIIEKFPLISGSKNEPLFRSMNPTMAEIALELIRNPNYELGNFNNRVKNPKTADEKIFVHSINLSKRENATYFISKQENLSSLGTSLENIHHLQSGKNVPQLNLTPELSTFLLMALGNHSGKGIVNSLFQDKLSRLDVIELLEKRPGTNSEVWSRLKSALESQDASKLENRTLEFQLKSLKSRILLGSLFEEERATLEKLGKYKLTQIQLLERLSKEGRHAKFWEDILNKIKSSSFAFKNNQSHKTSILQKDILNYFDLREFEFIAKLEGELQVLPRGYDDLQKLIQERNQIISERVQYNLKTLVNESIQTENELHQRTERKFENIVVRAEQIESLNTEQRLKLLLELIESDEKTRIQRYGKSLKAELEGIKTSLNLLVNQKELDPLIKETFLSKLNKLVNVIEPILSGKIEKIPSAFFTLRRELRLYYDALIISDFKLGLILSTKSKIGLSGLLDSNMNKMDDGTVPRRMTQIFIASDLIQSFMVPNDKVTEEILSGKNTLALETFTQLAREIGKIIAHYEGMDTSKISDEEIKRYFKVSDYEGLNLDKEKKYSSEIYSKMLFYTSKVFQDLNGLSKDSEIGKDIYEKIFKIKGSLIAYPNEKVFFEAIEKDGWHLLLTRFGVTQDPIESMISISTLLKLWNRLEIKQKSLTDGSARFNLIAWTKSLSLVNEKKQMEAFTYLLVNYAKMLNMGKSAADLLSTDISKLFSAYTLKYREKFFNLFIEKVQKYDSWTGQKIDAKARLQNYYIKIIRSSAILFEILHNISIVVKAIGSSILKFTPELHESLFKKIYSFFTKVEMNAVAASNKEYFGKSSHLEVVEKIRKMTPWSLGVDYAIYSFIQKPDFKNVELSVAERTYLVDMATNIRSLRIRYLAYEYILHKYGDIQVTPKEKLSTGYHLVRTYLFARFLWGKEVLEKLKKADNIYEHSKIVETAWETHVALKATKRKIEKDKAIKLLTDLKKYHGQYFMPVESEITRVFSEASKHGDVFLDRASKKKKMTIEEIYKVEMMKSKNVETPYHIASKVMLELMDEYADILKPEQKSKLLLYISGMDESLDKEISKILEKRFYATKHRTESAKEKGLRFKLSEIKDFIVETHPDERLIAFRSLFLKGISGHSSAEKILIDRLLYSDKDMPQYLQKVLALYLQVLNKNELSTRLMWLLANYTPETTMKGPEVLKLIIENGGVTEKKMAQLIASHGFNLPKEYRDILEIFKGNAQNVSKMAFVKLVKERLSPEKFAQIKSFDIELGSGSMKIGYLVTLIDGRRVVVMASPEFFYERTLREFQIARELITKIMADPDLRVENLDVLEAEMERIIKAEKNFKNEAKMMQYHKMSYESRPWLVKQFGNIAKVMIPQPMVEWSGENLLFEEYVKSEKFSQLSETSMLGWSKKDLAKASINEVLNQLLMYLDAPKGGVILDIDPHEDNQLAKKSVLGLKKALVNIDLGQSVIIKPDVVRELVKVILYIATNRLEEAFQSLEKYVNFQKPEQRKIFWDLFYENKQKIQDPVEVLTQTLEKVELQGIMLKENYLYFQKLFATLVGLKRIVADDNYIIKEVSKLFALRILGSPIKVGGELVSLLKNTETSDNKITSEKTATVDHKQGALMCRNLFNM